MDIVAQIAQVSQPMLFQWVKQHGQSLQEYRNAALIILQVHPHAYHGIQVCYHMHISLQCYAIKTQKFLSDQ